MIFTVDDKVARLVTLKELTILETRRNEDGFSKEDIAALNEGEVRGKWIMG